MKITAAAATDFIKDVVAYFNIIVDFNKEDAITHFNNFLQFVLIYFIKFIKIIKIMERSCCKFIHDLLFSPLSQITCNSGIFTTIIYCYYYYRI